MKHYPPAWPALWIVIMLSLIALLGCASAPPLVLGHCEIPQAYDYVASGPADLAEVLTPPQKHLQDELAERHEHKGLADDFNGLHDYVKGKCNG
jgi:hypothetical protein